MITHEKTSILGNSIAGKMMVPDRMLLFTYYHRGTEKELLENEQIEEASTYAGCYVLIYILGSVLLKR